MKLEIFAKNMTRLSMVLGFGALLTSPTLAHEWYDQSCCSDQDCAKIEYANVQQNSSGYVITLQPGEHPMVPRRPAKIEVPYNDRRIKVSQDGNFHACIISTPYMEPHSTTDMSVNYHLICLYVPFNG